MGYDIGNDNFQVFLKIIIYLMVIYPSAQLLRWEINRTYDLISPHIEKFNQLGYGFVPWPFTLINIAMGSTMFFGYMPEALFYLFILFLFGL